MSTSPVGSVVAWITLGLCLLGTDAVLADPPKPDSTPQHQPVALQVMVVHGVKEPGPSDPDCEELRTQLKPITFGSLQIVRRQSFRLAFGQRGAVPLPTGTELRIVPLSIIRDRLNLRVEVPGSVNTRIQMRSGRPVILGGPRHAGGHLIVRIVPEY